MKQLNCHRYYLQAFLFFFIFWGLLFISPVTSYAATSLTITPITWDIIGLDSNNVNVGPNDFPVGARVCNNGGSATSVTNINFIWDDGGGIFTSSPSADAYINLHDGTQNILYSPTAPLSLAAGACSDAFFQVIVNRDANAYTKTRNYHITATDSGGTVSTPTPRQLYVEYLISQSRNSVLSIELSPDGINFNPVAAGAAMDMMVGDTYWIRLNSSTATNGYNQIETFINFPNTIYEILSVSTQYSADSSLPSSGGYVPNPDDKIYGDGCLWDNDPNSPSYRSCTGIDGKAGGNVTTLYNVKVLSNPVAPLGNPVPLSTLIYDFSGSSYHYNSDYSTSTRFNKVVKPTINKSFAPPNMKPGDTSTLTFTITNPGATAMGGVNFTDVFPSGMTISNTTTSTNGCSVSSTPALVAPVGSASFVAGAASAGFSNISIAGNGICTITVNVTATTAQTYNNTTSFLYYDLTTNSGSKGTDTLIVTNLPPPPTTCDPSSRVTLATWSMPVGGTTPPTANSVLSGVTASTLGNLATGGTQETTSLGITTNLWGITALWPTTTVTAPGVPTGGLVPYFQFLINTTDYGGAAINYKGRLPSRGWASKAGTTYIYSSSDGANFTLKSSISATYDIGKSNTAWYPTTGVYTADSGSSGGNTYFRITFDSANASANAQLDDINITGCPRPLPPTLSKNFSPTTIQTGNSSVLTFTIGNPNTIEGLVGVNFTDTLPTGLELAAPNGLTTPSCTSGTLTGQAITASAGSNLISMSDGTLSAGASCTFSVNVKGVTAGYYTNVSSAISSTYTGPNSTPSGFGTSSLTVIDPPVITKVFGASTIYIGDTTSLNFAISNNNSATQLLGVAFTDSLPAGLVVASPNNLSNVSCTSGSLGGSIVATASSSTITLSGASLDPGSTCSFKLNVTGNTTGLKTNTVTVTSTNGGTGNTSTANIEVTILTPEIGLLKQVGTSAVGPWKEFQTLVGTLPKNVYFRFTVENIGDTTLSNVRVNDLTIPGLNLFNCITALSGNLILYDSKTCISGPIPVTVAGSYWNTANATSDTAISENSTVRYATAGLVLIKNVIESSFSTAGNLLHYNYTVSNTGGISLAGPVTVTDNKTTTTCPTVSTIGNQDGNFDPGENITCTAIYTVTSGDITAGSIINIAYATAEGINSNTDSETVYGISIPIADLTISKTDGVTSVNAGGTTTYTIAVTNFGPNEVTNATMVDTAPTGLTFGSWTCAVTNAGNGGSVTTACGAVSGTGNINTTVTMKRGAVITYSVPATIAGDATGTLTNTAVVTIPVGMTDPTPENNTATDIDTIIPIADVATTVTAPTTASAWSTVNIPITFTNNGPSTASEVTYTLTLPAGLSGVSCSGSGISCSYSGTTVTITGLPTTLTVGQTANMTLTYTGPYEGSVTVTSTIATTVNESVYTNNTDSGTTTFLILACDINNDGKIDIGDINLIFAARGVTTTLGDKRDLDGDKLITVNDARGCVLRCDNNGCVVIP